MPSRSSGLQGAFAGLFFMMFGQITNLTIILQVETDENTAEKQPLIRA
jgi:hypothetical protein